jgi:plastocyanin
MLAAALALGTSACGGGTGSEGSASGGGAGGCPDVSAQDPFQITIQGLAYHPSCLTAAAASSIHIVNQDSVTHNLTIESTEISVDVDAGKTFDGTPVAGVVDPGTYRFSCRFYPQMVGEITIV